MASADSVKSLAKELLDDANLEETEMFLTERLEAHMKAGRTERVIAVSALITKIQKDRAKSVKAAEVTG